MTRWGITCFCISLISAIIGFGNLDIAATHTSTAKCALLLFSTLFFIAVIRGRVKR